MLSGTCSKHNAWPQPLTCSHLPEHLPLTQLQSFHEPRLQPRPLGAHRLPVLAVDANEPPWLPFEHPLSRIESAMRGGCGCQVCAAYARTPLVTPCAHLVCTDCAAPHRCARLC